MAKKTTKSPPQDLSLDLPFIEPGTLESVDEESPPDAFDIPALDLPEPVDPVDHPLRIPLKGLQAALEANTRAIRAQATAIEKLREMLAKKK